MGYKVIAPLVLAKTKHGTVGYFYEGADVDGNELAEGEFDRLNEMGVFADAKKVESGDVETHSAQVVREQASHGLDFNATAKAVETATPPPNSATKEEWVAFAERKGMSKADAEAMSKPELVKKFG